MSIQKRIQIKRLKGKNDVDLLFDKGEIVQTKTLLLKYLKNAEQNFYFSGVSVPKKSFQKAVDRNRIRRLLRIAVKELPPESLFSGSGMLLFRGQKSPPLDTLIKDVQSLFNCVGKN
jgi:RNase P protein component